MATIFENLTLVNQAADQRTSLLFWTRGPDSDLPLELPLDAFAKMVLHNTRWERVGPDEVQRELRLELARVAKYRAFWDALKRKRDPEEEWDSEVDYNDLPDLCNPETCTQPLHTPLLQRLGCYHHRGGGPGAAHEGQGLLEPRKGLGRSGEPRASTTRGGFRVLPF